MGINKRNYTYFDIFFRKENLSSKPDLSKPVRPSKPSKPGPPTPPKPKTPPILISQNSANSPLDIPGSKTKPVVPEKPGKLKPVVPPKPSVRFKPKADEFGTEV